MMETTNGHKTKKCACTNIAELSRAAVDRLRFDFGAKEGKVRLSCPKCNGDYWVTVRVEKAEIGLKV